MVIRKSYLAKFNVIMDSSDHYLYASHTFGLVCSIVASCFLWFLVPAVSVMNYFWASQYQEQYLVLLLFNFIVSYIVGIFIAEKFPSIKLLFLHQEDMCKKVEDKTLQVFHILKVGKTSRDTGIVLMISLFEHVVHIRGDITVRKYFQQSQWDYVKDLVIKGFKQGDMSKGLSDGIIALGEIVKDKLPRENDDYDNELANKLHILSIKTL